MLVMLAALFFGMITFGFALLTLLPVILGYLMVGVYMEARSLHAAATANDSPSAQARVAEPMPADERLVKVA